MLPDHNLVRLSEYSIGIDYSSVIVEVANCVCVCTHQTWGKHLAQMLEALLQALEKSLSTSTSTNVSIK